ncbi:S9 family peptidase [Ponticaulis profundi]|uniref:S9 family peptidase n=1 Tax=Ponticaulis profundi TaxID=2665222 RepID=A0ABW1SCJ3_9PROT
MRGLIVLIGTLLMGVGSALSTPNTTRFDVDDYDRLQSFEELVLSPDGDWIVYVQLGGAADPGRAVIVQRALPDKEPLDIDIPDDARGLDWGKDGASLTYLSASNGERQVYTTELFTGKTRQLTNGAAPVSSYAFSRDGGDFAWTTVQTKREGPREPSLFEQFHEGEEPIIVDHPSLRQFHFVNPHFAEGRSSSTRSLHVRGPEGEGITVDIPGDVVDFHWSPDGMRLSIAYLHDDIPDSPFAPLYTSIGIFDLRTNEFRTLLKARPFGTSDDAVYYSGGEWASDGEKVIIRRVLQTSLWRDRRHILYVDVNARPIDATEAWFDYDIYPPGREVTLLGDGRAVVDGISLGKQSVFQLEASGARPIDVLADIQGDSYLASFDERGDTIAFVNEQHSAPPEIYLLDDGQLVQLSRSNEEISRKQLPIVEEVRWSGADGDTLQGWLLLPPDASASQEPIPLVTFLHGGPAPPMTSRFAQYYTQYGGIWPYPLELLALEGVAVFIPNYRGTQCFGNDFTNPIAPDREAVEDVLTGIESLVARGIADPERLGLSGHSHGAWLGSLIVTREKDRFIAASFAEGPQNNALTYLYSPMYLYERGYHELWGGGLWDRPERYLETSPEFHFDDVRTAILFEAGAYSQAITMMGGPKAATRAGVATEFVIYPQTGHNLRDPDLKRASAMRNLEWFLFWLKDQEQPDPTDEEQYDRWDMLRAIR